MSPAPPGHGPAAPEAEPPDAPPTPAEPPSCAAPAEPRRPARALVVRLVKLGLLAAVLFFVGRALVGQLAALDFASLRVRVGYVAAAFLAIVAVRCTIPLVYRPLLEPFCGPVGFAQLAAISWVPALGRYVPGKVFSIAWAAAMLKRRGVATSAAVTVPFLMMGLAVLTGLTVAMPLTLWGPVRARLGAAWVPCLGLLAAGLVCLHPRVMAAAGNFALRRLGREGSIRLPSVGRYVEAIAALVAQLACAGTALWLLARSLCEIPLLWLPACISVTALAASAGFLAFFAPAGIGVREGILLAVMTLAVGEGPAAILVVAVRLLQTLAEILLAAVGLAILRMEARASVGAEPPREP